MRKMFRFLFWCALIVGGIIGILRATAIRWWRVPSDDPYLTASLSPRNASRGGSAAVSSSAAGGRAIVATSPGREILLTVSAKSCSSRSSGSTG